MESINKAPCLAGEHASHPVDGLFRPLKRVCRRPEQRPWALSATATRGVCPSITSTWGCDLPLSAPIGIGVALRDQWLFSLAACLWSTILSFGAHCRNVVNHAVGGGLIVRSSERDATVFCLGRTVYTVGTVGIARGSPLLVPLEVVSQLRRTRTWPFRFDTRRLLATAKRGP